MAAAKAYVGRLAFDPDTEFHVDPDGKPVVTDDAGVTWRYATDKDSSHNARFQQQALAVDGTPNVLFELQLEHGRVKAEEIMREQHPHHFEVQPDDDHAGGVKTDPDDVAETITSHTASWGQ